MNAEIERIIDQLEREFDGEAWYGPTFMSLLADVTAADAARRVGEGTHSIWELVLHVTGWKREVAARLGGAEAGDPASGDWPDLGSPTSASWRAAVADLRAAQAELVAAIRAVTPDQLHQPVKDFREGRGGVGLTAYQTIYGLIQHDCYHAGQIAILKKVAPINSLRL